jgi:hypothetical protein
MNNSQIIAPKPIRKYSCHTNRPCITNHKFGIIYNSFDKQIFEKILEDLATKEIMNILSINNLLFEKFEISIPNRPINPFHKNFENLQNILYPDVNDVFNQNQ